MPATIFTGNFVKALKNKFILGPGTADPYFLSWTADPRSSAQSAPKGSLYMRTGTDGGQMFRKLDDGSSTNWKVLGSETFGNDITNPDFEASVTDWSTYADAAGVYPVDMTGGAANITFTRNTTTPLTGTGDGKITKDAVDRQGEGISIPFTIPN